MTNEWTGNIIIDEIDRLSVTYNKAKEYLTKITSGIDQQIDIWQYRQQIIREQSIHTKTSSTYDFLLPKTQRINELTLEAVQALCRVDLLIEQILRIDIKSRIIPSETNIHQTKSNGQPIIHMPVIRTQSQIPSGRLSTLIPQEKPGFQLVKDQPTGNIYRPSSILSQKDELHFTRPSSALRIPQTTHITPTSQPIRNYQTRQPTYKKEKVKLQRIQPGTIWEQAKIDIIDSLSGFYVGNLDSKVHDKFVQMQKELDDYYNDLDKSNQLMPLKNIEIGDFGVAKYSEDNGWYRARLITCEEHEQIKIVFVDFGNIEIKSPNEFFPLYKLFTDLPAQAIACSLSHAFPRTQNENGPIWSEEAIELFKQEVIDKVVKVEFINEEEGTEQWPLHFVRIIIGNQSVTNLLSLQQHIDPRPNRYIAEEMARGLSQQEYILFNVPINEDDFGQQ